MVAPFFPVEAEARYHASVSTIGLIFAAYPLAVGGSAPLWALAVPRLGRVRVYTLGTYVMAAGVSSYHSK